MPTFSKSALLATPLPMPGTMERSSDISALMKFARASAVSIDVAPTLKAAIFAGGCGRGEGPLGRLCGVVQQLANKSGAKVPRGANATRSVLS